MLIEVSIGEAIDKLCILELKCKKIKNQEKLIEIQKEINEISNYCQEYKNKAIFFYNLLIHVNEKIWDMTDAIKMMTTRNPEFSTIANQIFEYNQKRFRLKNIFNMLFDSTIKEQKSYSESHCHIIIDNEDIIFDKIPEINYLILEYDTVSFLSSFEVTLKNIFLSPTINYVSIQETPTKIINISNFVIEQHEKEMFELPPISYYSGGSLGDFIHQLSVVNEIFRLTGRKGNVYISDSLFHFRFGSSKTLNDTYQLVTSQRYINRYNIHTDQDIHINLSEWRNYRDLYNNESWYTTFKTVYNIEWATHPWLKLPYDAKWKDTVLVNTIPYRDITNIDFKKAYSIYGKQMIFITNNKTDYDDFLNRYQIDIPMLIIDSYFEMSIAIRSCKLFIAGLSSPLTIAHATHITPHVAGISSCESEIVRMINLDKFIPKLKYSIDDV